MTADRFSLKARRTTRIPLRIPVLIVHEHEGASRTIDGWTMIVNIHGAKIECKHPFTLHQEVTIQVPFNKMSQKGKVVWAQTQQNEKGNREFGVELDEPENLWGVGFPPSDWEATRGARGASESSPIIDLAPAGAQVAIAPVEEPKAANVVTAATQISIAENNDDQAALTEASEVPAATSSSILQSDEPPQQESVVTFDTLQIERNGVEQILEASFTKEETLMPMTEISMEEIMRQSVATSAAAPAIPTLSGMPIGQPSTAPAAAASLPAMQVPAPAYAPQPGPAANMNPTDKLSAFFNELVDSALEARLLSIVEGVSRRIESQVAQVEASTLTRIEEQAHATGTRQIEAMEQRTTEFLHTQQQAVLSGVQSFLTETENSSRQRHQDLMDENLERMQQRADAMLATGSQRLEQNAADLVSASQQGLRASMEQMLPEMQNESIERCRIVGERMMSTQLEQWSLQYSDRLEQGQRTMEQRLDATLGDMMARHSTAVSERFEALESAAGARLDQQLQRIGTQVRQTFLRHVVTELGRGQQVWLQQAQRQVERMAAEQLDKIRQDFSTMVTRFAEVLLQQTTGQLAAARQTADEQPSLEFPQGEQTAEETASVFAGVPESQS